MNIIMTRSSKLLLSLAALVLAGGLWPDARVQAVQQPRAIEFNRDIRPILSDKCFVCHGPDAPAKRIRLRLDSEAPARAAIAPGKPEASKLVQRITHADDAMRMPPADSGRKLTPREIELLTEWIRQGAPWQTHWAFIPPTRPAPPPVKNAAWVRNAIDRFVLARLEREGGRPAPEADRGALLRRVSLDLTGLPPTPTELDAFLRDRSPGAYEKVVDRLLASPRYGERMAFKWLDAARYADTNGYQNDGDRSMWRWRDWTIEAFNRNLPFDRFTIEQLAGDLLPAPANRQAALDQLIATAFNRNHRQNSEDGLIPEEYAVEYVVDRVDTTATVFLGLTMGCARCHNHKYDPIAQREYYQLYAYFNSVAEDGRASYHNSPPWVWAPTVEQQRRLRDLETDIANATQRLDEGSAPQARAVAEWASRLSPRQQWFPAENLLLRQALDDGSAVELIGPMKMRESAGYAAAKPDLSRKAEPAGYRHGAPAFAESPTGQAAVFDGRVLYDAGRVADFDYSDRLVEHRDQFAVSAWFYAESENSGAIVTHMQDNTAEKDGVLPKNRGYGLFFLGGRLHWNVVSVWADDSWRVETAAPVSIKQWHHVTAIFDARIPYDHAEIWLDGRKQPVKLNLGRLFRTFADAGANLRIGGGAGPEYRFKGMLDEVRVYRARPDADEIAMLACADSLPAIAALPASQRSRGQWLKLRNAWLEQAAPLPLRETWTALGALRRRKAALEREFPLVMTMKELPAPRPSHVLRRGAYDQPGEVVPRGLPAALQPKADRPPPADRLELARWLVSRDNPLTARVQVNRLWQMLFGAGLVRTVEDFGSQGELPSHPELLDWLASEFMNADCDPREKPRADCSRPWDIQHILRLIVTSATYRQTSHFINPDPENRLLARGPRLRLPAEMIRDQALFVSGLLVEKRGGPSVRPYQPEGLLKDMVFSNMTDYRRDRGEGLWRRSLYTFWKRTVLNPGMLVFDATAREQCTVRETRTNTPLQALNLMNDVTYIEAARMLAERMLKEGGATPAARLAWAFRALTARTPDAVERRTLLDHLHAQMAHFQRHPEAAAQLLGAGEKRNDAQLNPAELAAYATTASLLLNLDEAITKP
jgi:Protein of unknown function (DUF1553)/Protein of unknown function (DUF1549)/Concanavalin A-like lectin/glucanases superfamily/Planctomycete cytochrome C